MEFMVYYIFHLYYMAVCQNLVPLVNIKIAGKWMFIPLKMVLIGIDPYPYCINLPKQGFPTSHQTFPWFHKHGSIRPCQSFRCLGRCSGGPVMTGHMHVL